MNKDENKGLADNQEGEFILNESGTSVTIDADVEFKEDKETSSVEDKPGATSEDTQKIRNDK